MTSKNLAKRIYWDSRCSTLWVWGRGNFNHPCKPVTPQALDRSGQLAWLLVPKFHVPWLAFFDLDQSKWKSMSSSLATKNPLCALVCIPVCMLLICEAMCHVLKFDIKHRRCNPRFFHTFIDEDSMMTLKRWAKRANPKKREQGIMRIFRLRMKTLSWRLKDVRQKRKR